MGRRTATTWWQTFSPFRGGVLTRFRLLQKSVSGSSVWHAVVSSSTIAIKDPGSVY
jgi:hypothetical protein